MTDFPICPKFEPLFDSERRTIIMDSGRSSGKTTTVEEAAVFYDAKQEKQCLVLPSGARRFAKKGVCQPLGDNTDNGA